MRRTNPASEIDRRRPWLVKGCSRIENGARFEPELEASAAQDVERALGVQPLAQSSSAATGLRCQAALQLELRFIPPAIPPGRKLPS
jgi:hypothetical protein